MIIPILIMSSMGLLFGLGLAFASKIFKVHLDPKIEKILGVLPGANCGACGKAGCAGLAEAIAKGDASLTSCPPGGEEASNKIADILGVEKSSMVKKIARIKCGGGDKAKDKYSYNGIRTCLAASLMAGGQKKCSFGCLGYGDCAAICPFDAIHIGEGCIPIVNKDKCTACGKCVEVCPKNIIILEEASRKYFVKCSSKDKILATKDACKAGCIGCKVCEKLSKGAFIVEDNLSRLDYSKVDSLASLELSSQKCPTKCIVQEN
ncbi:MAG: RnfABCDGE type electron transport complex subunit B [Candidatus Omnitrophota bacterium]